MLSHEIFWWRLVLQRRAILDVGGAIRVIAPIHRNGSLIQGRRERIKADSLPCLAVAGNGLAAMDARLDDRRSFHIDIAEDSVLGLVEDRGSPGSTDFDRSVGEAQVRLGMAETELR